MTTEKLIELYGRRFTPFARLAGFVAILISSMLIAFSTEAELPETTPVTVEQPR